MSRRMTRVTTLMSVFVTLVGATRLHARTQEAPWCGDGSGTLGLSCSAAIQQYGSYDYACSVIVSEGCTDLEGHGGSCGDDGMLYCEWGL